MRKIGDILLDRGLITKEQLQDAVVAQKAEGKLLGEILLEKGFLTEDILTETIASILNLKIIQLSSISIHHKIIRFIPASFARKYKIIPAYLQNVDNNSTPTLFVAVSEEPLSDILKGMSDRLKIPIRLVLTTTSELNIALDKYYPEESGITTQSSSFQKSVEKKEEIILEGEILEGEILDGEILDETTNSLKLELNTEKDFSSTNSLIQNKGIDELKLDFSAISTSPKISQNDEPLAFLEGGFNELKLDFTTQKKEDLVSQKKSDKPTFQNQKTQQTETKTDKPKLNFLAAFEDEGITEYVEFEEKNKENKINTDSFLENLDIQPEKRVTENLNILNNSKTEPKNKNQENHTSKDFLKSEKSTSKNLSKNDESDYMITNPEDFLMEEVDDDEAIEIDIHDDNIQSIPPLKKDLDLDLDLDEFSLTDPGNKSKDSKKTPPPIQKEGKKPALPKKDGEQKSNTSTSMLTKQPSFTKNHKKFTEETDPKIPMISEEEAAKRWLKKQSEAQQNDLFEPLDLLSNQDPMKNEEIDKIIFENDLKPFKENFLKQLKELKIKKESYALFENMFLTIEKNPLNLLFFATIETLIIKNRLSIDDIFKVIQSHLEKN